MSDRPQAPPVTPRSPVGCAQAAFPGCEEGPTALAPDASSRGVCDLRLPVAVSPGAPASGVCCDSRSRSPALS